LNGFIVTLLVLSFYLMRRSPKGPVKLELRDETEIAADQAREATVIAEKPRPKFRDPRLKAGETAPVGWATYQPRMPQVILEPEAGERSLNVFFNWNGHTWDAYEVLGLPGGSSQMQARSAYERAAALADNETLPFLKAALDAIAKS
jgi:hypothetical protein